MSEKTEITFMQTRLIRLASEERHLPVEQIIHWFKEADVLGYIEKCYNRQGNIRTLCFRRCKAAPGKAYRHSKP